MSTKKMGDAKAAAKVAKQREDGARQIRRNQRAIFGKTITDATPEVYQNQLQVAMQADIIGVMSYLIWLSVRHGEHVPANILEMARRVSGSYNKNLHYAYYFYLTEPTSIKAARK